jgi:hypothetical protein
MPVFYWLTHPAPITAVPTEALVAIASVAVVIWTGGFIVRGWMQSTTAGLMAGMNYLQFAFFGAILALLANALTLRCLSVLFFLYYASFFRRHLARLRLREPEVALFLPFFDAVRVTGERFWIALQVVQLVPLLIAFIWPDPRVVAWACAAMTFLGYQILLAFIYSDVLAPPRSK